MCLVPCGAFLPLPDTTTNMIVSLSHTESSTVRISGIGLRAHAGCCWFGVQAKPVKSTCRFVWPQLYIPCRFWMGYNHTFNSFDDNPAVAHPLIFFCLEEHLKCDKTCFRNFVPIIYVCSDTALIALCKVPNHTIIQYLQ